MNKVRKAVILAAGFGTRFLPVTKSIPKEMFPIVDVPAMQYLVEEAVEAGIKDILIVISRNKKMITDHFDKSFELEDLLKANNKNKELKILDNILPEDVNIYYHVQKEMRGPGAAVKLAESFTGNEPFVLFFGDDLIYTGDKDNCSTQLLKAYEKTGKTVIATQYVPDEDAKKYGVVNNTPIDEHLLKVNYIEEKPTRPIHNPVVNIGRYVLTKEIYSYLDKLSPHDNGEVYFSDALDLMGKDEMLYAYQYEGKRYDLGDKLGFLKAQVEYALRNDELKDSFYKYLKEEIK